MKATSKNIAAKANVEKYVASYPNRKSLEITKSGKVHSGMGALACFTNEEAAKEVLTACGFKDSGIIFGSFTTWTKPE